MDAESLRSTVGEVQSRQNALVRQLQCVTHDTALLAKDMNKLRGAIAMMNSELMSLDHLVTIEAAILGILQRADRFFLGLDALMDGHLSMDLVKTSEVEEEFQALSAAAFKKKYAVVFPSLTQVYQLPASFLSFNGSVHLLVGIPIVPVSDFSNFGLYKYLSKPLFVNGTLLRLSEHNSLLAISKDKSNFIEISDAMIHSCLILGKSFLCHFPSVVITDEYPSCLRSVFSSDASGIFESCSFTFLRSRFYLERLNATAFVSFSKLSTMAIRTCNDSVSQIHLRSYQIVNLSPGCILHAGGVTFYSAFSPSVHTDRVITEFPSGFSLGVNDTSDYFSRITSALGGIRQHDSLDSCQFTRVLGLGCSFSLCPVVFSWSSDLLQV